MSVLLGGAGVVRGGCWGVVGGRLNLTSLVCVSSSSSLDSLSRENLNGWSESISGRESLISLNTWRMFARIFLS